MLNWNGCHNLNFFIKLLFITPLVSFPSTIENLLNFSFHFLVSWILIFHSLVNFPPIKENLAKWMRKHFLFNEQWAVSCGGDRELTKQANYHHLTVLSPFRSRFPAAFHSRQRKCLTMIRHFPAFSSFPNQLH